MLFQGPEHPHRRELDAAPGVGLRVEKDLGVTHVVGHRPLQVRPGQVVEILRRVQYGGARVINVEKRLQVAEVVGRANFVFAVPRQSDTVPLRKLHHQPGLECSLDVQVQLGFWNAPDELRQVHGDGDLPYADSSVR